MNLDLLFNTVTYMFKEPKTVSFDLCTHHFVIPGSDCYNNEFIMFFWIFNTRKVFELQTIANIIHNFVPSMINLYTFAIRNGDLACSNILFLKSTDTMDV